MYEKQQSMQQSKSTCTTINPTIQRDIILNRSEAFWEKIKVIDAEIENCTEELADGNKQFL